MGKRQDGQGGVGTTTMVGKMLRTVGLLRPLTTTRIGRWREGRLVKVLKDIWERESCTIDVRFLVGVYLFERDRQFCLPTVMFYDVYFGTDT